jgi:hypothetical protein
MIPLRAVVLPRKTLSVLNRVHDAAGRCWDWYDRRTADAVWWVESSEEGLCLAGAIRDALAEFRVDWVYHGRPGLWCGRATFDDGKLLLAVSLQRRLGRLGVLFGLAKEREEGS